MFQQELLHGQLNMLDGIGGIAQSIVGGIMRKFWGLLEQLAYWLLCKIENLHDWIVEKHYDSF